MTTEADPTRQDLHRVFISYSRRDFYFAEQLAAALRRHGLTVWFDVHELVPGTDWSAAIDQAIAACDTFVLVASRAALASPYVQREHGRAVELARACVAVLPRRLSRSNPPAVPTYDLTTSFRRGVDQLVSDLATGRPRGRPRRLPLPCPGAACLVALAPACCAAFTLVLGVSLVKVVVGHEGAVDPDVSHAAAFAVALIAGLGAWSAYVCWAFSTRRVSWLNLRGSQLPIPFMALFLWWFAELIAGLITDPIVAAFGGSSDEVYLGGAAAALVIVVVGTGVAAAIATSFAAGVCRHLKTGIAPRRVRRRHIGTVPREAAARSPARTFGLFAVDADARVADDVRRALTDAGMADVGVASEGERQIVVVSDRTPTDWLSWDTLPDPVAVVATSVALPVRGVLQRFQWVDHRRRRRRTLTDLGRSLTAIGSASDERAIPDLPERLELVRLPRWVVVAEWTLLSMATLATVVAAYPFEQRAFTDGDGDWWPTVLCLPIAAGLVLVAWLVRRREITLGALLAAVAASWLGMIAFGLDRVMDAMYSSSGPAEISSAAVGYPVVSAIIFGLAWRSLRAWLPRRAAAARPARATLGTARGSWPWWIAVTPLVAGLLAASGFTTPDTPVDPLPTTADDVCRDRAGLRAVLQPLAEVNAGLGVVTKDVRSFLEARIEATAIVIGDLEPYEPIGSWGAEMRTRLIAGLERGARADQAYLDLRIDGTKFDQEHEEMNQTVADFNTPFC